MFSWDHKAALVFTLGAGAMDLGGYQEVTYINEHSIHRR